MPPESREHKQATPEFSNTNEAKGNNPKNNFMKMTATLKEKMKKSCKEMEKKTNQKLQETIRTVQGLKAEIETIEKIETIEIEKPGK